MSINKLVTGLLVFAKPEATYNSGATIATTDVIQIIEAYPVFNYVFAYNGDRKGAQWTGGQLRNVPPSGRTSTGKVMIEGKGVGTSYVSGTTPPNIHPFLLASGFTSSFASSSATWTYTPVPLTTTPLSAYLEVYDRGEKLPISGCVAEMAFSTKNAGPMEFEFDIKGVAGIITDVANPPSRSFQAQTVLPPKNENIDFTINGVNSLKVRSYNYKHGLTTTPRIDINSVPGHAGFAIGRRKPEFKCVVEAEALSTINPYDLFVSGTSFAASFQVGSTVGNTITVNFNQATITACTRAADGPLAMWDLTITPYTSAPDASDDVSISFS